jgi:hypothetical protein
MPELAAGDQYVGNSTVKLEKRVEQYIAVRDKIKEIQDKHSEELAPLIEMQNLLTTWLQDFLSTAGAQSVKTSEGTVYASTRYSASLGDPQAFMDYVIKNSAFDLMDRKANATAVRDFVETHKSLPPGVNLNAIRTIGVRRAGGK